MPQNTKTIPLGKLLPHLLLVAAVVCFWRSGVLGALTPESAPFPATKLSVLVVRDMQRMDDYTPEQVNAINSTLWKEYVTSQGGDYDVVDPTDTSDLSGWQKEAFSVEQKSDPWLVVSNGKTGASEAVVDLQTMLATVKEHGK